MTPAARVELGTATKWHFALGQRGDAESLVRKFHYTGSCGSAIAIVGSFHSNGGLFGDYGDMVAACFFGWPPARWSERVLELVRLVRIPDARPPLSSLVAKTAHFIQKKGICDLLVSYADSTQGHHGGVYQACSWRYGGQRAPRMEGVMVNGTFIAGRQANNMFGTRSPTKLSQLNIGTVEGKMDVGKHFYWRALNKNGQAKAERLGLLTLPYPKPERAKAA